ncbi:alpha/beta hydrolase family protein [Yoonia sp. R2331]|uniref:alpha/beta hydrolase family protein n=1 Tax=Yoonia sp. R2331 TaxID=3237238 RepID=UPI0034E608BA
MKTLTSLALTAALAAGTAAAQNRIDTIRPDAPALADYGEMAVGVTTRVFTMTDQVDVVNTGPEGEIARADRPLTVEIWYPALDNTVPGGQHEAVIRDGTTTVMLEGYATRGAVPATQGSYPLVILSHGYPGNRWLMGWLGENLASKGYVVVSIDHKDSTYSDQAAFGSTLVNRPWDQRYVIDRMAALKDEIGAITDAENAAVVGYSMGGYGALIYAGAGVTQLATAYEWGAPQGLLERNMMGTTEHQSLRDDRVKAFVAFGPWGNNAGFWDASGLSDIHTPLMLIAGEVDDVSGYEAIRGIFDGATGITRHLLTFEAANHNAGAPMPAPAESYAVNETLGWAPFEHYADAVWDNVRMNNVSAHFVTAYLDLHLKGDTEKADYLMLQPNAADGVWAVDDDGAFTEDHTYWTGFGNRTAAGLRFETKQAE